MKFITGLVLLLLLTVTGVQAQTDTTEAIRIGTIENMSAADVGLPFDTTAAPDDAFTADIRKLMDITGAMKNFTTAAELLLDRRKVEKDSLLREFYDRFYEEMANGSMRGLVLNYIVNLYRRLFTPEEIKALISFYDTPVGRKVVKQMPVILKESMSYGEQVGRYYGEKIMSEVMQKHQ